MTEVHPDRIPYLIETRTGLTDETIAIFHSPLLTTLSTKRPAYETVAANLGEVVDSETTLLAAVNYGGRLASTATLNTAPILTGNGYNSWIDDVVTDPDAQGQGLSKMCMNTLEDIAKSTFCNRIFLTSTPERGAARVSYEKRGYRLLGQTPVFRNSVIQERGPVETTAQMLEGATDRDVEQLSELLQVEPTALNMRLNNVLESRTSQLFVNRTGSRGDIRGVAVANMCPIPVGYKPWIDDIEGYTRVDRVEARLAAENWVAESFPFVNIIGIPGVKENLDSSYEALTTGLYNAWLPAPMW
jgi:GNAT superfamily N-acetyltransferase